MHFPFFALVVSIRQHKIVSFALDEGGQTLTGSFGKYITFGVWMDVEAGLLCHDWTKCSWRHFLLTELLKNPPELFCVLNKISKYN